MCILKYLKIVSRIDTMSINCLDLFECKIIICRVQRGNKFGIISK